MDWWYHANYMCERFPCTACQSCEVQCHLSWPGYYFWDCAVSLMICKLWKTCIFEILFWFRNVWHFDFFPHLLFRFLCFVPQKNGSESSLFIRFLVILVGLQLQWRNYYRIYLPNSIIGTSIINDVIQLIISLQNYMLPFCTMVKTLWWNNIWKINRNGVKVSNTLCVFTYTKFCFSFSDIHVIISVVQAAMMTLRQVL